jgi:hypothetical protein
MSNYLVIKMSTSDLEDKEEWCLTAIKGTQCESKAKFFWFCLMSQNEHGWPYDLMTQHNQIESSVSHCVIG